MTLNRRQAALATAAALAGWSHAAAGAAEADDRTLKLAIPAEPSTLDPTLTGAVTEARIVDELFEALVSYDGELNIVPGAAERWEISADGLSTAFHLRPGLRYSNGEPVLAAHFVYALRRQLSPATAATGTEPLRWIRNAPELLRGKLSDPTQLGVEAPDEHTVVIALSRRDAMLLNAATRMFPLRQQDIEVAPRTWTRPGRMVSNGPYQLKAWVPNGRIELVVNPYWRGAAALAFEAVRITVLPDRGTAFKMFRTGELHVVRVPDERLAAVAREYGQALHDEPVNGVYFLALKQTASPFEGRPGLRRALALATDTVTLIEKVQRTGQIPAFSFNSPGLPGYTPAFADYKDWSMARRLDEARALYAAAGYGPTRPLSLTISYATDPRVSILLQAVAEMWHRALGIETRLENSEFRVFMDTFTRKRYEVAALGWTTSRIDAALLGYLSTPGDNELDFADPRYTAQVDAASAAATPAERAMHFNQAERLLMDDQPLIPLAHGVLHTLVAPRLRGWTANLADIHPARFLSLAT